MDLKIETKLDMVTLKNDWCTHIIIKPEEIILVCTNQFPGQKIYKLFWSEK